MKKPKPKNPRPPMVHKPKAKPDRRKPSSPPVKSPVEVELPKPGKLPEITRPTTSKLPPPPGGISAPLQPFQTSPSVAPKSSPEDVEKEKQKEEGNLET